MLLTDLTEQNIENALGLAPGVVPFKALTPLFNGMGKPILRADGSSLVLSYTHAALYTAHLLKKFDKLDAIETKEIVHLPVPFLRSTNVHLVSRDACAIFAMGSNINPRLQGVLLPAAGGLTQIEDNGYPEDNIECGWRELCKETGLRQKDVGGQAIDLGLTSNPILDCEIGEQKLPGRIPNLESEVVIVSNQKAHSLIKKMSVTGERIGGVVFSLKYVERLEAKFRWSSAEGDCVPNWAMGDFYPAIKLLERLKRRNGEGSLADVLHTEAVYISDLRKELSNTITPHQIPTKRKKKWKLGKKVKTLIWAEDFETNYGSAAPLSLIRQAATQVGMLSPR